jgi:hypothetical protein
MLRTAVLCLLSTSATLLAQEGTICRSCEGKGVLECKLHKGMLEKEQAVKFCSVACECKQCGGALQVDCRSCRNPEAEAALAQRQKLCAEWLAGRRKAVDEITKSQLMHLETAHFELTFSIRPMTVGRDKVDTHPLMHLYGERLEALRTLYLQTFGIPEAQEPGKLQVFMFRDMQDHSIIAPRVTGIGTTRSTSLKLMGPAEKGESAFSMYHDLRAMPDDEALHRNIIHNVTHLLLANMPPVIWIGNRKSGWIDEGLANWFEDKLTGRCTNYCEEEVAIQPGTNYKGGRWRPPVRLLTESGKGKSFAELSVLNTDQLNFEDHALCFAYVDFLITSRGGTLFADLCKKVKGGAATRDALRDVYHLDPIGITDLFRAWVKETYPTQ